MSRVIPQTDDWLIQVMVVTKDAHGRGLEIQAAGFEGGLGNPARGENAQYLHMGKEEHVAFDRTHPRNDIDRFHLVKDVVDRVPSLGPRAAHLTQIIRDRLIDHRRYIRQHGEDMPEIRDWKWGAKETGKTGPART